MLLCLGVSQNGARFDIILLFRLEVMEKYAQISEGYTPLTMTPDMEHITELQGRNYRTVIMLFVIPGIYLLSAQQSSPLHCIIDLTFSNICQ